MAAQTIRVVQVHRRQLIQRPDGTGREVDIQVDGADNHTLLIEVKKRKEKSGTAELRPFLEVMAIFQQANPDREVHAGFLSLGGFTKDAMAMLTTHKVGTATALNHYRTEWSP